MCVRKDHGIDSDQKLICILPGSRRGEVTRHLSIFGEALARYCAAWGDVFAVIPTVPAIRAFVEEGVSGLAEAADNRLDAIGEVPIYEGE